MNPLNFQTFAQKSYLYDQYFSLCTNNKQSYADKLKLINLICYLQQKMHAKDPVKYKDCLSLMQVIFGRELDTVSGLLSGEDCLITALAMFCDNLLWGTTDEIPAPEGYQTLKDVKQAIIKYINEEWMPF